jgi:hypothetical protein
MAFINSEVEPWVVVNPTNQTAERINDPRLSIQNLCVYGVESRPFGDTEFRCFVARTFLMECEWSAPTATCSSITEAKHLSLFAVCSMGEVGESRADRT